LEGVGEERAEGNDVVLEEARLSEQGKKAVLQQGKCRRNPERNKKEKPAIQKPREWTS